METVTTAPARVAMPVPERQASALCSLYPARSILARVVEVTQANTDLPSSAALFSAYSLILAAMAQAGFTVGIDADPTAPPNIQMAILFGDEADPNYIGTSIIRRIFRVPALVEVPASPTAPSLFAHACTWSTASPASSGSTSTEPNIMQTVVRCLSLLAVGDSGDWLKGIHAEPNMGKLRRQLQGAFSGERLHQWTKKGGDEYSPPVHLSVILTSRQTSYFAALGELFFSSPLVSKLLVVLANDRPQERKASYRDDGIDEAASAWTSAWDQMLAGPRAYSRSPGAERRFSDWWMRHLRSGAGIEVSLRAMGRTAWRYALAVQALMRPDGAIGEEAIGVGLAIADRHLADLAYASKSLASETAAERLTRKVKNYLEANPKSTRGRVMNNVRGASDPAALNNALVRIIEMNPDTTLGELARELRSAARGS